MQPIIADLHTHTLVSNHAFGTAAEMAKAAFAAGLDTFAITDHGVAMPDSPHPWYFFNLVNELPFVMEGIPVLKGVEANITDTDGALDMAPEVLKTMDWVIASIHPPVLPGPISRDEGTRLWLAVAENPLVDMIGHSELAAYEYDYDLVTRAFAETGKVVEMNGNSAVVRPAGLPNMKKLALACMKNGTPVAVNSDAHSTYRLGKVDPVLAMLDEVDFPDELVVNSSRGRLLEILRRHKKPAAEKLGGIWNE